MALIGEKLKDIRRVIRLHTNWLTVALLGKDAISEDELRELEDYGKLPTAHSLDFSKRSFILGRLQATKKSTDYTGVNYQDLNEALDSAELTTLEEYAIEYARLHAAEGLKGLSNDIAAGAFDRLKAATQQALNEASIKEKIGDETALALAEKKAHKDLATVLVRELKTDWRRDWERVAETELHRAKVMGAAQAIINRVGPYKNSDGPDSRVSIVPNPDTCVDCDDKYLEPDGTPKVFKLSELLSQGSNADPGVTHTRKNGKHHKWKTTLPPLHTGCGCKVVFLPTGMDWVGGKLKVVDQDIYAEAVSKAVDKTTAAPTITPPGPKSAQVDPYAKTMTKPASISGVAAPGQTPGPGRPSGASGAGADPSSGPDMVDCPFGGGDDCKKHGGNGAKHHDASGEIMKKHREALSLGAKSNDPAAAAADQVKQQQAAKDWGLQEHPQDVVLDHLENGSFEEVSPISDGMSDEDKQKAREDGMIGATDPSKARISGNGNVLVKPNPGDNMTGEGKIGDLTNCPVGNHHNHEVASYKYYTAMGTSHVPPTAVRNHEGKEVSVQKWAENTQPVGKVVAENGARENHGLYQGVIKSAPADKQEDVKKALDEIIALDLASNQGDLHAHQIVVDEDFTKLHKIDNGAAFGNGTIGCKNSFLNDIGARGGIYKVPDHIQERWKTTTMSDLDRALGDHLDDWQVGQQFMRQQYMLHLQEAEGHIDPEKFRPTWGSEGDVMPRPRSWDAYIFSERDNRRELPHQLFEDWAKNWIDEVSYDPSHPHHESAKQIKDVGIFMPPGSMKNVKETRAAGKHRDYEKKILPRSSLPKTLHGAKNKTQQRKLESQDTSAGTSGGTSGGNATKGITLYLDLNKGFNDG